jgi:hypothetical protein
VAADVTSEYYSSSAFFPCIDSCTLYTAIDDRSFALARPLNEQAAQKTSPDQSEVPVRKVWKRTRRSPTRSASILPSGFDVQIVIVTDSAAGHRTAESDPVWICDR